MARQIRPILFTNLDRGRIRRFTDGRTDLIPVYVWHVAERFSELNGYLHLLQSERSIEVWGPLFERMQTWAYNFFLRKNFAANKETQEIAVECATDAAISLLSAHFPYDTDFDAWAHIIVQNSCRKFIHKALKKSAVPDGNKVDLQDDLVNPDDPLPDIQVLQKESGAELENALAQLSDERRSVIKLIFFDELEPEEVARKLGKSVGAVYSLQFHGLRDLRKILSRIKDKLND
jgi:RNA polymerase sigma factor (sigma-70 family)